MVVCDFPATAMGISRNFARIAVEPIGECNGRRNCYMTTDGGNAWSPLRYDDFSC